MMGEYRGIMNLCRLMPAGTDAKLAVDEAIDRCAAIGNLRTTSCGARRPPKVSGPQTTRLGQPVQTSVVQVCVLAGP